MSTRQTPQLVPTNLHPEEVIMDNRGVKDPRYYCLPPDRRNQNKALKERRGGGFPLHLVSQGHIVGTFDNWLQAKASVSGYPDASHVGCSNEEECIEAWQALCPLGIHPHPVEPRNAIPPTPSASAARFVNTSPRKSAAAKTKSASAASVKKEQVRAGATEDKDQVLADLLFSKRFASPIRSPPPSPSKTGHSLVAEEGGFVNFAIRGGGIVSSSPARSEQRYLELQRSGHQPDMLMIGFAREESATYIEVSLDMPRAGTADRRRRRLGLSPVKPGKVGWVHGTKLAFFSAYEKDYTDAAEVKETGKFYSRVAHLYLAKYGYNTPWTGDLEPDKDVADDVNPNEDIDKLPANVAEDRNEYFKILRGKIGVWYNSQYGGSVSKKKKKPVTFKTLFNQSALEPPAPVKARTLHYYSRHFYHERVKPMVTARWAAVSKLPKPPKMITVRTKCTKEAWNKETPAFQAEVIEAIKAEHKIASEAYTTAISGDVPTTAEQFNVALNNAAYYLQPFADAIHERYGMNVAIMMCGPVPDRGGRIEVRSIHAGMTNGLVPRIWTDFDRAGFDAAQRSFINFSHQCFTESECRERALNGMAQPEGPVLPDASSASEGPQQPAPAGSQQAPVGQDEERAGDDEERAGQENNEEEEGRWDEEYERQWDENEEEEEDAPPPDDEYEDDEDPAPPPKPNAPEIREHLQAEMDAMSSSARKACMNRLWSMSEYERERENNLARNRMLMKQLDLASGSRELLDKGGSGAPEVVQKTREKRKKVAPPPGSPRRTRARGRANEPEHPAPPREDSPRAREEPNREDSRPRPRPVYKMTLVAPEFDRSAEGPLGDPGEDIGMERPEFNRQAEGPLSAPVPGTEPSASPPENPDAPLPPPPENPDAPLPPPPENPDAPLLPLPENPDAPLPPPPQNTDLDTPPLPRPENATAPAPAPPAPPPPEKANMLPAPLEGPAVENAETGKEMWGVDVKEYESWPPELRKACAAFTRAKSWGGDDWERCVRGLIALERAWGFPEKGMLSAPGGGSSERPAAIPFFMKNARKWGALVDIQAEIGPHGLKGSYADSWWVWWTRVQPAARVRDDGKLATPEDVETEEWADLAKTHGRNGVLLYLGGLLWWGEAAAAADNDAVLLLADWQFAVRDVANVLSAVLLGVAPWVKAAKGKGKKLAAGPANAASRKRKQPVSATDSPEKENIAPPRKRTRLASALADSSHTGRRL
ncbi:hypothetical protein B0H11DRAFT_1900353 [Mycena galericulata]|nr:hypothetical protein B0H11DRAFT_1900350 [Mycena galericulata]KAJ7511025.1 hypothetical protein B0H11DRAFT_1900353 [Mycena galericulata]